MFLCQMKNDIFTYLDYFHLLWGKKRECTTSYDEILRHTEYFSTYFIFLILSFIATLGFLQRVEVAVVSCFLWSLPGLTGEWMGWMGGRP